MSIFRNAYKTARPRTPADSLSTLAARRRLRRMITPDAHVLVTVSPRVAVRLLAVGEGVTIAILLVDGEPVRVVESGEG